MIASFSTTETVWQISHCPASVWTNQSWSWGTHLTKMQLMPLAHALQLQLPPVHFRGPHVEAMPHPMSTAFQNVARRAGHSLPRPSAARGEGNALRTLITHQLASCSHLNRDLLAALTSAGLQLGQQDAQLHNMVSRPDLTSPQYGYSSASHTGVLSIISCPHSTSAELQLSTLQLTP